LERRRGRQASASRREAKGDKNTLKKKTLDTVSPVERRHFVRKDGALEEVKSLKGRKEGRGPGSPSMKIPRGGSSPTGVGAH